MRGARSTPPPGGRGFPPPLWSCGAPVVSPALRGSSALQCLLHLLSYDCVDALTFVLWCSCGGGFRCCCCAAAACAAISCAAAVCFPAPPLWYLWCVVVAAATAAVACVLLVLLMLQKSTFHAACDAVSNSVPTVFPMLFHCCFECRFDAVPTIFVNGLALCF